MASHKFQRVDHRWKAVSLPSQPKNRLKTTLLSPWTLSQSTWCLKINNRDTCVSLSKTS